MADTQTLTLTVEAGGERLDRFVTTAAEGVSRTEVQRLIKAGEVSVNGEAAKASYRLEPGDVVRVVLPVPEPDVIAAEDIALTVLYEDGHIAIVDKPAGMVVHPAYGNLSGTLVNAALARWPEMRAVGSEDRAGVVHRLDKGTSGVIAMAKTPEALADLQRQFKERTVYKQYIALVERVPDSPNGVIDAPIARDPRNRQRMAVVRRGRPAATRFDVLEVFDDHALLALEPQTGRTHQLRVHLAWLGHPIVGDRVYGYRKQRFAKLKRLFLHAAALEIDHPATGERIRAEAPLPAGLEDVLNKIRRGMA